MTLPSLLSNLSLLADLRGLPVYWTLAGVPIVSGPRAWQVFLGFDDAIMATNLRAGNTPMDFPETSELLAALGGLDARVDIDPADILVS